MRELIDFENDVVVVTGAASGIGRGVAEEFAREGADVIVADIDAERGPDVAAEITAEYRGDATFVRTDVSDYEACRKAVDDIVAAHGGIDVLVNVAAGGLSNPEDMNQPFVDETPDNWEPHIQITLRGPLNMTHNVIPHMRERGGGSIVNFASDSYMGQDPNLTLYASVKAAVVTFTKSVAKEVGREGIRVNCISPSTTRTPSTADWLDEYGEKVVKRYPLGRLGLPRDHANATVFLASDAAEWITGQVLSVNGGYV